ncbi:MAG: CBS domain-containing protein [Anaerolineae bacterium]|nr:CBS domain-containing protein [Anaerolineae bacterium]
MRLILTHENADFDAVASQLAAHKLYPDAVPLLSRRVNRNVSQFLTLHWGAFAFVRPDEWRRKFISQVILVDTQTVPTVRGIRGREPVIVIDHHTGHPEKAGWQVYVEPVGAAVTLLVEKIQAAGLTLTPIEATLLLLGIYEDTGALTYDTTTARDGYAAAWLLDQGAQLGIARQFLNIPLTPAQQAIYDQLNRSTEWYTLHEQPIAVASAVAPDDFSEEISSIVHRLRDDSGAAGLVALVQLKHHVQMVARSTHLAVDVAVLAKALGGGGHSRAAAAMIPDQTLAQVKEHLLALLPQMVKPAVPVEQIMSYRVQTLPITTTVREAHAQMQRTGHEGYPVVNEAGHIVGLLTRRSVDRAMNHRLEKYTLDQVMKSGRITVRPTDSVTHLQRLMMEADWGQIPVVDEQEQLIGIVTRTDLLRHLTQLPEEEVTPKWRHRLAHYLSPALWALVQAISDAAASLNLPLYLVGGPVRDFLLNHPLTDADMVVEGEAIRLVEFLRGRYGGECRTHPRFGTATWLLTPEVWQAVGHEQWAVGSDNLKSETWNLKLETIDFVTARSEFYAQPSALPQVERGSIKLDLHRRDFTINTLAIRLDGAHLGELLDFYGGQRDLQQGVIRVLHSLSFVDDPTRILRAVRFEQRLGFTIEPRTLELVAAALPMLDRVSGERIRHELEHSLREADPRKLLQRLHDLGVLAQLHPQLSWNEESAAAFSRLGSLLQEPAWAETLQGDSLAPIYFITWLAPFAVAVQEAVTTRIRARLTTREDIASVALMLRQLATLPAEAQPGEVERMLRPHNRRPRVFLAALALTTDEAAAAPIQNYFFTYRHVRTYLTGDHLRQMGLKPGPQYGQILDDLLAARLNGQVQTAADEQRWLAAWLTHA